jgi:hypothetical protein
MLTTLNLTKNQLSGNNFTPLPSRTDAADFACFRVSIT